MSNCNVCARASKYAECRISQLRNMTWGNFYALAMEIKTEMDVLFEVGAIAESEYDLHYEELEKHLRSGE